MDLNNMISAQEIHKSFWQGGKKLEVLKGIHFVLEPQKKVAILGVSGAGKSTLLHIFGGLDAPTQGRILVENKDLYALSEKKRALYRARFFGFVFQFYHLLPELTALENVSLPAWISGFSKQEGLKMGALALKRVGLEKRGPHLPSTLSGGEQQRVALARALVLKPKVILADEPTGNLDRQTGQLVLQYLLEVVQESQGSLVLVTHNEELTKELDEVWELKDGILHKR